jgi:hypothetical protein
LQSSELKAHNAAALVSKLNTQLGLLDVQIASETKALTADPGNQHLKTTISGQSKTVRSLTGRENKALSSLLALNAKIEHMGGTPVLAPRSTTQPGGPGSGTGGGGGRGGGVAVETQTLAASTAQFAALNGVHLNSSDPTVVQVFAGLWNALKGEGETILFGLQSTSVTVSGGMFQLKAIATDGVTRYPFIVTCGLHGENLAAALDGTPSPLLISATADNIAITVSGLIPNGFKPLAPFVFEWLAEHWVNYPSHLFQFSYYYTIVLVQDTAVTSGSDVYQVLDLYAQTFYVTPRGISPSTYFPVVFIVSQDRDFPNDLVDPLIPTSSPPPVSYYPSTVI